MSYKFTLTFTLLFLFNTFAFSQNFIDAKDACRQEIMDRALINAKSSEDKAPYQGNEKVEDMADLGIHSLRNIEKMDDEKLKTAELATRPWSDHYWPIADGMIATRYADPEMPSGWREAYEYVTKNPIDTYLNTPREDWLSPAEKYSVISLDRKNILSETLWSEGKNYIDENGNIERWMGLCHGWAAASIMLPAPSKKINHLGINFYPSDIKALGTLLWANGSYHTKFMGGRCNKKKPKRDDFGRILDQECFDINPGSWHMAIVNQIGISKRSFVMDMTYDYQVWNQPVYSYKYEYFNPQTGNSSQKLSMAMIAYKKYSKDKFVKYRKENAKYIVGIEMTVEYVIEVNPNHDEGPFIAPLNSAVYRYDLELDDQKNIVGGEWHSPSHPDFLWLPVPNAKVQTSENVEDNALLGLPVASIVETLFDKSK